jgi:ActR/RegA family two-component response regulator
MSPSLRDAVLIVEDVDHKYEDVISALRDMADRPREFVRARTVVEAADLVKQSRWRLLVLDISMDIAPGSGGTLREGHANLGGLDILEQMYLLEREMPTVIVTGFDYFVRAYSEDEIGDSHTLQDLEKQARAWIGNYLLGCVRYGSPNWADRLRELLGEVL